MREFRGNTEIRLRARSRPRKAAAGRVSPSNFAPAADRRHVERSCDLARNHGGAGERGMTAALDQTQEAVAFDELDLAQLDRGDVINDGPPVTTALSPNT